MVRWFWIAIIFVISRGFIIFDIGVCEGKELSESKKKLEAIIHKDVSVFAYSHGRYDKDTLRYTRQNYKYAMSVKGFPLNFITNNKMLIPRINIENITYDRQFEVLKKWTFAG